jgi:hypothetical protein
VETGFPRITPRLNSRSRHHDVLSSIGAVQLVLVRRVDARGSAFERTVCWSTMTMDTSMNHSQWFRVGMRVMQIRGAFIGEESGLPSLAVGTVSCTCDVRGSPFSSSSPAEGAFSCEVHLFRSWDSESISQDVGGAGLMPPSADRVWLDAGRGVEGGVVRGGNRGENGRWGSDRFRFNTWSATIEVWRVHPLPLSPERNKDFH